MSDLLINWLNDEVQLSRRITNFEDDFHNGYLFGELLSKYSQQLNFNEFIDRDDKASRINNFTLLYDTFKTLKVSFDSNIAMNIIQKKVGISKKVLYELKMQLQKTTSNAFTKVTKSSKPLSPLKKIPITKEKFDKISKEHFSKQLNEIHKAQKNINLESSLQKFPQFHEKQLIKAEVEEKKESQTRLLGQIKFRQKQLENIKKSSEFRADWEQSNLQKWAANMSIRKIQNQKDTLYKTKIDSIKIQSKTMSEINAIKALDNDIKQFEKKALNKNARSDDSDSDNEKLETEMKKKTASVKRSSGNFKQNNDSKLLDNRSKFNAISEEAELRKKKSPQQVEQARHQREKRRRKMIVEQSKKHQLIKIERRQKYIMSTLEQNSKQEKQIEYEIWRAWQNKEIIVENKNSFNEKLKEKEETRAINAKFKDEELVKTYREQHQKELKDATERQSRLKTHNAVKARKQVYNQCREIIENFIEMTEILYEFSQQKNREELDEVFVNHLLDQFVESTKNKKQIAELQLHNYIKGKGEWNIEIKKDSEQQVVEPVEDNALPLTVVNNYYLGNILKTVFSHLYPEIKENQQQESKCQNLIALLGLQFAGKKLIAEQIKQSYGFNTITINALIENKLKDFSNLKEQGIETDGETAELVDLCYEGKPIPNHLILSLLKSESEKHEKCLIVDYPLTYEECTEFTKVFGNTEPEDFKQKSKLKEKIQSFSRLVWPTETKIVPRSLKPCGIDFALWIDISPKTSLDRFLGRRWNKQGKCIHINSDIENPNELRVGDKASPTILKNNFKIKNKQSIKDWLLQFGIKVTNNDLELIQSCWEEVSGEESIEAVTENVFEILNKALDIKGKRSTELKLKQENQKQEVKKREEREKFEQELKQKCALSTPEEIRSNFKSAIDGMEMNETFLKNVQKIWNNTQKITVNALVGVFQILREQDNNKNKYIANTVKNFIRLLTREDERFYLVKKFQNDYNAFFDQSYDMVSRDYTKEELHQRIEDLETNLLTLIEQKKEDAITERQNIMNSGWLQSQMEQIVMCMHAILQAELNRSFACQQIIMDFYSKKYMVSTGEIQEGSVELNIDSSLDLVKEGTYPRLDKLLADALRIFNREEEVVDDKNKKGGKAPPKKDDKKPAKKGGKDEVQQKAEPTPEQLEFKKALNTEKAIFRYRLKVISAYSNKRMKEFQNEGLKLYSNLEDLYVYTDKIENKSVIDMTAIFKAAIEEQKKIENQVQINYTEVIETELIRNFEKPKPIILPAVEKIQEDRFSIGSIMEIIKIFTNQSEAGESIKTRRLITLFEEFSINERYRVVLPKGWKNLTVSQHEKFISKFDKAGKGEIQLWIVFVTVALSNAKLPTHKQIQQCQLGITGHNPNVKEVTCKQLQSAKTWFDSEEPIEQNIRPFLRNEYLKRILFDIFKKKGEVDEMIVEQFIKRISMSQFRVQGEEDLTYFEFAFPASDSS